MSKLKEPTIIPTNAKTKQELEKELREEGYRFYEWSDPPGAYYSKHSHEYDECICVINGKISFYINNKEYELTDGQKFYLSKGTIHEARNKGNKNVTYLVGEMVKNSEGY